MREVVIVVEIDVYKETASEQWFKGADQVNVWEKMVPESGDI